MRRKVKLNLNEEQRKFIKEVREQYPARGLRVRKEDKVQKMQKMRESRRSCQTTGTTLK